MSSVRASTAGVYIHAHVTPSSKTDSVAYSGSVLRVKTTAPADKGKANKAVIKLLKPLFGACEVTAGHRARRKTIHVRDADSSAVEAVLRSRAEEEAV